MTPAWRLSVLSMANHASNVNLDKRDNGDDVVIKGGMLSDYRRRRRRIRRRVGGLYYMVFTVGQRDATCHLPVPIVTLPTTCGDATFPKKSRYERL